jgi:hypothetical protein
MAEGHSAAAATPQTAALTFRDSTHLSQWLIALLCISFVVDAVSIVSGVMQYNLLTLLKAGAFGSQAEAREAADANDLRQRIIGIAQVAAIVGTIVVFCLWIYRAGANARALGAHGMRNSPGWAVGWYFIPFANLWKPYQAMKEIWQASQAPANWQAVRPTALLGWWWALFLISGILGNISFRLTLMAKEIDTLLTSTMVTVIADVASLIAVVVALLLVRRIYGMQNAHPASA